MVVCVALLPKALANGNNGDGSQTVDVSQNGHSLKAMPSSCVALHRGQICYQRIRFDWTSSNAQRLCLFHEDGDTLLHCSVNPTVRYVHDYSSPTSESYTLRVGEMGPVLSRVTVHTSWVYRTGRRSSSGWRLF